MKYTIINIEDIPKDLPVGVTYKVRLVKATWEEIKLEWLNEPQDSENPSLFTITKSDV